MVQEVITSKTANSNLISLTGYRTLVLLELLMDSPKSIEEINEHFLNDKYIQEKFSTDTLRLYLNSLREIGCTISRASKSTNNKYVLHSHPFDFDIPKNQMKAILRVCNNLYDKIDVQVHLAIEKIYKKIEQKVTNEATKAEIRKIYKLKSINYELLEELLKETSKKNQIVFLYKSPKSGEKEIELITKKISFKSGKLYIYGYNVKLKDYSYFRVDRIIKLLSVKLIKDKIELSATKQAKAIFELYNNPNFQVSEDEKIIEKMPDKIIIETSAENKFALIQKLFFYGPDCKVISPVDIQETMIQILNEMKDNYR